MDLVDAKLGATRVKRYGVLILIWVGGLLPVVIATTMYLTGWGVPDGRTQHGEMIAGQLQASDLGITVPSEDPKWLVILAQGSACAACDQFEAGLTNFHAALGRERDRVEVRMQADFSDTYQRWIWVLDPLGNVVLKFDPATNPTLILSDLKKLLKLSKVG